MLDGGLNGALHGGEHYFAIEGALMVHLMEHFDGALDGKL